MMVGRRHRRSIRLSQYDYTQAGAYFVTICIKYRECLLGKIVDGEMRLHEAGRMVQTVWNEIPAYYSGVETDTMIVMPNHVHGIVVLVGAGPRACPEGPRACPAGPRACPEPWQPQGVGQPQGVAPTGLSLPDVVHRFKTMTTKRYIDGVQQCAWSPFPEKLWQRNYYEHIIRDEDEMQRIGEYIVANPERWHEDRENPECSGKQGTGDSTLREAKWRT